MKRIINKYFGIVVAVLSLLHTVSCSNEMEITGGEDAPGGSVEYVALSLTIPVTDMGDSYINNVYVDFFLGDGDRLEENISSFVGAPPTFTLRPDGNMEVRLECPIASYKLQPFLDQKVNAYVRVFANYSEAPGILEKEDDLWNKFSSNSGPFFELKPLFISGVGKLTHPWGWEGLRSYGQYGRYTAKVSLSRQLAKVRVKLGVSENAVPANLEIDYNNVKVQLLNAANYSDPLESRDVSSTPGFKYINYPERTGSTLRMKKEEGIYKAGEVIDSCYIHENIRDSYDENTTTSVLITIPSTDPNTGFKETHSQLIKITGDDGYRLKRNHVYTLDLRLRSQKGLDVQQRMVSDWGDEVLENEVDDSSYIYTSGPLILTPSKHIGDIFFESGYPVNIDLSGITANMNITTETVYENNSNKSGYIRFKLTNPPVNSFSFYVTLVSVKNNTGKNLSKKIKVTCNPS